MVSSFKESCGLKKLFINSEKYKNGGPLETTGAPTKNLVNSHDFIRFLPKTKENIFLICSPLYEQGLSLREIERQTGFAKTTIRESLTSTGLPLRKYKPVTATPLKRSSGMRSGTIPYGYAYLEGKLVPEPKEYKIVLNVCQQWKSGHSFRAISRNLNDQRILTRTGKKWTHELIKRVIDRHESDLKKPTNNKRK